MIVFIVACQRADAVTTTTTTTTTTIASSSSSVAASAVLTPLTSTAAPAVSSVVTVLPPLETSTTANATSRSRVPVTRAKRDPMKACCDALRKETPPQFAQAATMCDGFVSALDQTGDAPKLEGLLKPMLLDAPVPAACKGL